jgi:hypothetical protein
LIAGWQESIGSTTQFGIGSRDGARQPGNVGQGLRIGAQPDPEVACTGDRRDAQRMVDGGLR